MLVSGQISNRCWFGVQAGDVLEGFHPLVSPISQRGFPFQRRRVNGIRNRRSRSAAGVTPSRAVDKTTEESDPADNRLAGLQEAGSWF
jgi:hypothetical protein